MSEVDKTAAFPYTSDDLKARGCASRMRFVHFILRRNFTIVKKLRTHREGGIGMKTFFGVLVAIALFAVPAFAAETGQAKGKVVDLNTNAGVEGVAVVATTRVEFEEDKPYATVTTTTAKDGTYTLKNLLATIPMEVRYVYTLSFEKAGYILGRGHAGDLAAGKTKLVGDIALCPIPTAHGVYRITNETAQFLQQFVKNSSIRPAHPLTYEPLPQAKYKKTPIPGKKDEFTRELTVSRETVIPQILHRAERTPGEPLMVICNATERDPTIRSISEDASIAGERRFTAGNGRALDPTLELPLIDARCFVIYSGSSFSAESGHLSLPSGFYSILVKSGGGILAALLEVLDPSSGDDASRCRAAIVVMRQEIAAFRQSNRRWPTYEEFNEMKYDGHPLAGCYNPFSTNSFSKDADALKLKKGDSYVVLDDCERLTGWLYSPLTGEVWAATSSGNGEAGW